MTSTEPSLLEQGRPTTPATPVRTWLFRLGAVTVLPPLLLLLLEGALRLGGFGYSTHFFVKVEQREAYTGNPRFGWRFFPRNLSRTPVMTRLPASKDPEAFRVFILGGSAAQGTPEPAYGFGRMLEVMLQDLMPGRRVDVVNAAMTAINSHVVRSIARDSARFEPDLFIVYMGNNEVVGPFGPGTAFASFTPSLSWVRTGLWVRSLKIGQLTKAAVAAVARGRDGVSSWRGMAMFTDHRVNADDPRLMKTYQHFRSNLEDILETATAAGAPVVVCTIAVNLKDNAPFASLHRPGWNSEQEAEWEAAFQAGVTQEDAGQSAQAIDRYRAAATIDNGYAELHFRWARCACALGHFEEAHEHYARARDLDALRFRADTSINRIIRDRAVGREREEVYLLDAERVFEERSVSDHGIPGETFFYDHVHFNPAGNYELARVLFEKVAPLVPGIEERAREPTSREHCAERLALTGADEYWMAERIGQTTAHPPFTYQLDHLTRREQVFRKLRTLREHTTHPELEHALSVHRQAVESNQEDLLLRFSLAQLLRQSGAYDEAAIQERWLLDRLPDNADLMLERAITLSAQGEDAAARGLFETLMTTGAYPAEYCDRFGEALYRQGRVDDAIKVFKRGLALEPGHARMRNNLGSAFLREKLYEAARAEFQEAVRLSPDEALFHSNLGAALIRCRRLDEAAEQLERSIAIDAFDAGAHNYLGVVRARQGRFAEAAAQFEEAIHLDPENAELRRRLAEMKTHLIPTAETNR